MRGVHEQQVKMVVQHRLDGWPILDGWPSMKIGVACPVWREYRYLPLVLEQMALCPGPKIILWQDQPLFWIGEGPAPSGHQSPVRWALQDYAQNMEIITMNHAPPGDEEYGGFSSLVELAFSKLAEQGVDTVVWMDSDWLMTLEHTRLFYQILVDATEPFYYDVMARHYWRTFEQTYATTNICAGYPITETNIFTPERKYATKELPVICYHPSYVLTDMEVYDKVNSFGHAPYFKERGFFEKEWQAKNDSIVNPRPADLAPPVELMNRLMAHGSLRRIV